MKAHFTNRQVQYRPTAELAIHKAIAGMPRLDPEDPRYDAMRGAWMESGILPPLYVTAAGKIVDGRHRWWFAKDMRLAEVPVIEVDEDEVATVVMAGISGRNHLSKGQRAYLSFPYLQDAWEAAQRRRIEALKAGSNTGALSTKVASLEELAERLGCGRDLMFQAKRLHELFGKIPALKDTWEPRILHPEEPVGLGAAIAGIAGQNASKGKPRPPARNSALRNFTVGWENLIRPASHWDRWNEEERELAVHTIRETLGKIPTPALDAIAAAVRIAKAKHKAASDDSQD